MPSSNRQSPVSMLPTQINSPLIQFLLCAAQTVRSRHRDAVLQFARCSEAVILWQSSCYTEEDGAGGTQRGPSPGQAHRTRGGSSIYFLFCPNHQPWTRKNTRKLCPGPSIMKRKTSMKPTATLEEKKLALITESKEDNLFCCCKFTIY